MRFQQGIFHHVRMISQREKNKAKTKQKEVKGSKKKEETLLIW